MNGSTCIRSLNSSLALGPGKLTATEFVQDGPTTGNTTSTDGIQATSHITLKLTDLKVAGLDIPAGPSCETSAPATIAPASAPGFNARFAHCLLATR